MARRLPGTPILRRRSTDIVLRYFVDEAGRPCAEVPLTKGKSAIIDAGDGSAVAGFSWYAELKKNVWYAYSRCGEYQARGTRKIDGLHQFLMGKRPEMMVDHIDGDGLNNRRSNLRFATNSLNLHNQRRQRMKAVSGFRGVYKVHRRWQARLTVNHERYFGPIVADPEEAARHYDAMAIEMVGEFAGLNFPRRESDVISSQ